MAEAEDLELARRHAPVVYFDSREPFLPQLVGYSVLTEALRAWGARMRLPVVRLRLGR